MDQDFGINQAFIEELWLRYQENPGAVSDRWRRHFDARVGSNGHNGHGGFAPFQQAPSVPGPGAPSGSGPAPVSAPVSAPTAPPSGAMLSLPVPAPTGHGLSERDGVEAQSLAQRVHQMISAFRLRGHLWADLDPLGLASRPAPELTPAHFGIREEDLDAVVPAGDLAGGPAQDTVRAIVARLEDTYCRTVGVEFMHIEELEARVWLRERMEVTSNRTPLTAREQLAVLGRLIDAEIFEQFLHTNFLGAKRFSLEGGESMIPLLDLLIDRLGDLGAEEMVIGMAHRGRLNVLCNIMQKPPKDIFAHFLDQHPQQYLGRGDVKYHLGYSSDRVTTGGRKVHLSLTFNPSHLEFVNPVVEGRVRAKQDRRGDTHRTRVVPLLLHGDAAFIGQGVVAETFNLMNLEGYTTGGTVHVVINNQVGFTTDTLDSRSTRYATDLAKMLGIPIFHVNGEDPEAVAHVARIAADWRQRFRRDVVIDMYCYRKWGHNEGDEPRYTQPLMYAAIDRKPTVRAEYVRRLLQLGAITVAEVEQLVAQRRASLDATLAETRASLHEPPTSALAGLWDRYKGGPDAAVPEVDTAVPAETLHRLLEAITTVPEGFHINPKLRGIVNDRRERLHGKPLDWGTAEALAFATLLDEGTPVRLSGQDARRGTFSHRHSVWTDTVSGQRHASLATVARGQARFEVYDSALSETGVLGFDYGYSLDYPDGLTIWEAQFGDFANGAQVIIDQFLASGEDKWARLSGLVMLLPHGFEGGGPEHSSARLERFLQLSAEDNMYVVNPTTPAQLFHCLRRQVLRVSRKPLIVMTPKSHLRSREAVSALSELSTGGFQRIIGDPSVEPAQARKVIVCAGKVFFDLDVARRARGVDDVALLRLEQLYPLSKDELTAALAPYRDGTPLVWVQEDPANMGAWYYLAAHLPRLLGGRLPLSCVARDESASPATGSPASHKIEQQRILDEAFA